LIMDSKFWKGLMEWIKGTLVRGKCISPADLDIFHLVDTPEEAVDIIKGRVVI
jgi:predicted Rossmann-fold nucleotide-binding protein